jgi:hypothetical protein
MPATLPMDLGVLDPRWFGRGLAAEQPRPEPLRAFLLQLGF